MMPITTALSLSALALGAADEPALVAPPVDLAPGPAYADDQRRFQGIPGLVRAPGGRLWATWYAGGTTEGPENYVLLVNSADDGATWSAPLLVIDPPGRVRAFDPCLWVDPTGRLWLFWAQSYSWYDGRAGVWAIHTPDADAAQPVWSAPERLTDGIMMNKPIVLSTGEWVLPAAVWPFSAKSVMDPAYARNQGIDSRSRVVVSADQGATWHVRGMAEVPERSCDEHLVVERRDGTLWMVVRTRYGLGESVSKDRGVTWSPGGQSALTHIPSARFYLGRLASGRLLLVKHDPPDGKKRSHLKAWLSDDDGTTWRGGLLLDERPGVSYPDVTEAPDGAIYVVYDYQRTGAKQILMAVFTEQDVLDARFASPRARERVVINQAHGAPVTGK